MRTKNTDQWKQGLQQVVAVRPAADDMQEQVEFGGCGAGQFHLEIIHTMQIRIAGGKTKKIGILNLRSMHATFKIHLFRIRVIVARKANHWVLLVIIYCLF